MRAIAIRDPPIFLYRKPTISHLHFMERSVRHLITIATCALILTGCGTNQPTAKLSGTVSAHCENEINGAVHQELKNTGRLNAGMYDNDKSEGWKVDITWSQVTVEDSGSTYDFDWSYTIDSEAPVSGSSDIVFDGKTRAVAKVDDQLTISIDPRTFRGMHPEAKEATPLAQAK